jgi:hypothetical protein
LPRQPGRINHIRHYSVSIKLSFPAWIVSSLSYQLIKHRPLEISERRVQLAPELIIIIMEFRPLYILRPINP